MNEVISIIVPVYNSKKYLERCIESILNQTYPYIQLILVDDGSTDGSGEICDRYAMRDKRIRVIHQNNQGVSVARNSGIDAATGSYLGFVDSDDTISQNTFECIMTRFCASTDAVFFGVTKISENDEFVADLPIETGRFDSYSVLHGILKDYSGYGCGYPVNKIWRNSSFGEISQIPRFDKQLYYFEDLEWVVRMLLRIKDVVIIDAHMYNYRIHSNSVTNQKGNRERRECGYHQSIWRIIFDLQSEGDVQQWFSTKYYPELVNGVIFAWKNKYKNLRDMLMAKLVLWEKDILSSSSVNWKIKFRCRIILFLHSIQLL